MKELQDKIIELENRMNALLDYSKIPLELENALIARGFSKSGLPVATGIVKANSNNPATAITGVTGSVYVASSSGGPVTTLINFTDGVRT